MCHTYDYFVIVPMSYLFNKLGTNSARNSIEAIERELRLQIDEEGCGIVFASIIWEALYKKDTLCGAVEEI